jgi:hypothetical protein
VAATVFNLGLAFLLLDSVGKDLYAALTSILGLFLTSLPLLLRRRGLVFLPWPVTVGTGAVILLHVMGIRYELYDLVWWWDAVTHMMAAFIITLVVATALVSVDPNWIGIPINSRSIAALSIAVVVVLGAFWEIAEFAFDGILGMNMQYSLDDTATDLSFDILGGTVVALMVPWLQLETERLSQGRFRFWSS